MNDVKKLLAMIGKENIDENSTNLLGSGILDSLDVMSLVEAIEQKYDKTLDTKYIEIENFQSLEAIRKMIKMAFGE